MFREGFRLLKYKIVETSNVTDEELEQIVNEWVGQGWEFEGFHFVNHQSSHRPVMAFVTFTTTEDNELVEDLTEESSPSN